MAIWEEIPQVGGKHHVQLLNYLPLLPKVFRLVCKYQALNYIGESMNNEQWHEM